MPKRGPWPRGRPPEKQPTTEDGEELAAGRDPRPPEEQSRALLAAVAGVCEQIAGSNVQLKSIAAQCFEGNIHLAAMSEGSRRERNRAQEILKILCRIAENTHGIAAIADNTHALCGFAGRGEQMAQQSQQWPSESCGGGSGWNSG